MNKQYFSDKSVAKRYDIAKSTVWLGHDPFTGHLYAFTNKRRNKIKCLFWEDNGFVLYYKSLSEEKFKWPKRDDKVMTLTGKQINWLLDGYDISAMKGHKKLHYEAVFSGFFLSFWYNAQHETTLPRH